MNNWTKANRIKQNRNWQQIWINIASLNMQNWRLNHDRTMFARVKCLCDYGTDNCNPINPDVCCKASDDILLVSLLLHQARGLLKNHRTPQQLCCLTPNAPVQYRTSSLIAMIVSQEKPGDYRFLLCAQRTFCSKPNWIRAKGSMPEKNITSKKELFYLWVKLQKAVDEVCEGDDEWEPVEPITSPCDNVTVYWGLST